MSPMFAFLLKIIIHCRVEYDLFFMTFRMNLAKIWLVSFLLTQSPNAHAKTGFSTNDTKTNLIENFTEWNQEMAWDIISFEDAARKQRIMELIDKSMDNEKIKGILEKYNYNREDVKNIIYEILTSDTWRQLLTKLSHDKNIENIIDKSDSIAIERKLTEKEKMYIGIGWLILIALVIWWWLSSSMKWERAEQDPYN